MKTIAVVVTARASYARIKSALRAIADSAHLRLVLILGGSLVHRDMGRKEVEFDPAEELHTQLSGDSPGDMARTVGLSTFEFAGTLERLKPDLVLTVADRYETLANAISASYMNISVAHLQGGESTGSIDDRVRHAISRLSDYHFPATHASAGFLERKLGINPGKIWVVGCPSIDLIPKDLDAPLDPRILASKGSGIEIDPSQPYGVVMYHPVTTDFEETKTGFEAILGAVKTYNHPVVWLWPNIDSGRDWITKRLKQSEMQLPHVRFFSNIVPEQFYRVLGHAKVLVGNSSVGIRECSYIGCPVVDIGSRQNNRERGANVITIRPSEVSVETVAEAMNVQHQYGRYERNIIYGDGKAGERIARVLEEVLDA